MNAKEKREDHLHAVWFAAGTAVVVACLQRSTVASIVERWRVWVFLTLNLLLLAILFTSTCTSNHAFSTSSEDESSRESNTDVQHDTSENKKGRKQKQFRRNARADEGRGDEPSKLAKSSGRKRGDDERQVVEDEDNEDDAKLSHQLSKEELNERVEAFIAMFRQQLVSDAKNRRSRLPYSAGARKHCA